ncbi:MAG: hypothetical protein QNJ11_06400 [Woeseiaceae bacterium]|nr:hypothetical protein [Woeseiaceae bacterium]
MKIILATAMILVATSMVAASELPDGWYRVGDSGDGGYTVTVGDDIGYEGAGLEISGPENTNRQFGGVGQSISASDYAGKTVRITAFIRTESVDNGYAGLWFRVDKGEDMLVLDNMNDRGVTGTTDWHPYTSVLRVDAEATSMLFGAILTGSGRMFVDEFAIDIVPDDTPTTAGYGPNEPKNLSF